MTQGGTGKYILPHAVGRAKYSGKVKSGVHNIAQDGTYEGDGGQGGPRGTSKPSAEACARGGLLGTNES